MMRRASTYLALLGFGVLGVSAGLPAGAVAAPTLTVKAAAVPIPVNPSKKHGPTYPGTGNILGAGASLEAEYRISGTEYGGFPLPLTQVKVYLPAGVKLHPQGFATCTEAALIEKGAGGCAKKSFASSLGEAGGVVSFGETRVHESVTVQGVFGPGGDLLFYVEGTSPVSIAIISKATVSNVGGQEVFTAEVPLIESVPGAPYASAEYIKVKVGAAFKKGNKLVSYGTLPKKCKGGLKLRSELTFLGGEKSTASYTAPCPRRKK